ncbi:hypothetical protein A4A49_53020 [Nicotiana attenuata]|uniref:Uncharacterized protein n=1 Tax=Nicotiana attenuata TaxID=49451 RepID=A0A1J6ISM0_NICAT|nr:hypothetical protein A4A49_53020 [Nicotiana attenuata]
MIIFWCSYKIKERRKLIVTKTYLRISYFTMKTFGQPLFLLEISLLYSFANILSIFNTIILT